MNEVDYLYNIDNNRSRINILPLVDESAELAITSYLVYLVRKK